MNSQVCHSLQALFRQKNKKGEFATEGETGSQEYAETRTKALGQGRGEGVMRCPLAKLLSSFPNAEAGQG